MGWTLTNVNSINSASSFTLAVNAGDLLVGFTGSATASASVGMSDNVNGSWTQAIKFDTDRVSTIGFYYKIASTTATLTISATASNTVDASHAGAFGHTGGTIPGTVNVTGSVISAASKTVTTTADNVLLVGGSDASGSNDAGTGFSLIGQTLNAARFTSEYETDFTNTTGSNTVTFSQGTPRGMIVVAFDPPAGGASVFIPIIGRGPGLALAGGRGLAG